MAPVCDTKLYFLYCNNRWSVAGPSCRQHLKMVRSTLGYEKYRAQLCHGEALQPGRSTPHPQCIEIVKRFVHVSAREEYAAIVDSMSNARSGDAVITKSFAAVV